MHATGLNSDAIRVSYQDKINNSPKDVSMLEHGDIWRGVDRLAAKYGLSPSGLAKRAGLDPTTFNKSKRTAKGGKQRWPSTESVAKILSATGASLEEFVGLIAHDGEDVFARRLPVVRLSQLPHLEQFDTQGVPTKGEGDEILFPQLGQLSAFALEITDDSMAPVYRDGDVVVVSPESGVRRGDRVVVKTKDGRVTIRRLMRKSAQKVELAPVNGSDPDLVVGSDDVAWMSRILWASQ